MKITNEIKAKVFSQYLGQSAQVRKKNDSDKDYLIGRICETTLKSNHGDWVMVWFDDVHATTNQEWRVSNSNAHTFFFTEDETKLILRPISQITDEDAIYIYLITQQRELRSDSDNFSITRVKKNKDSDEMASITIVCLETPDEYLNINFYFGDMLSYRQEFNEKPYIEQRVYKQFLAYQFLQSKGYDLPQYLLGGKTLFESGLAIYE